jgi:hypothetical protein
VSYLGNLGTAFSQSLNTVLGGHPDESVSARAYRNRGYFWGKIARMAADTIFFWDLHHCRKAHESDIARAHELLGLPHQDAP